MADINVLIPVKSHVLAWARRSYGIDPQELARVVKLKIVDGPTIENWEINDSEIPLRVVKKIAKAVKRPLAFFFLDQPPAGQIIPTNFRTLPEEKRVGKTIVLPTDALMAIRRARVAQQIFEQLVDDQEDNASLVLRINTDIEPELEAHRIRQELSLDFSQQRGVLDSRLMLKLWIKIIEGQGIVVQRDNVKIRTGFRGFCLLGSRGIPPIIFLSKDGSLNAQIFTLIHEYCHLLSQRSGLKIDQDSIIFESDSKSIERYCNRFAAEFLVPKTDLLTQRVIQGIYDGAPASYSGLQELARHFGVSKEVILIRMKELHIISEQTFDGLKEEIRYEPNGSSSAGFKHWDTHYFESNGPLVVNVTFDAYHKGRIDTSELLSMLRINTKYLGVLEDKRQQYFSI